MGYPTAQAEQFRAALGGRRVCVTGGAGFIGGHLVKGLLDCGAEVTVIDDLSNSEGVRLERTIDDYPGRARFVFGSILDPRALSDAVKGAEIVFHQAAVVSVPRSVHDPLRTMAVNDAGTARVAEACRSAGVKRWIYAASSSAYGDEPALPKAESMLPKPISPYAASKLAGEAIVRAWASTYGLSGVSLRYFNVLGPHQPADGPYSGVVAAFCAKVLAGEAGTIYGDGNFSRDFTPVANVVYANLLAATSTRELQGEVINVGVGERTTILKLWESLARTAGRSDLRPRFEKTRPGDVPHSQADLGKARQLLGYAPIVGLEDGLAETLEWGRRGAAAVR